MNISPKSTSKGFSPSLLAFIIIIAIFFGFYFLFGKSTANGLNLVWIGILIILFVLKVVVYFMRKIAAKNITQELIDESRKNLDLDKASQEILLSDQELLSRINLDNKELAKAAKKRVRSSLIGEIASYFWLFLVIFLLRTFAWEPFVIPSGSMEPTLTVGDYIGVNKHYYRLQTPVKQDTIVKFHDVERGDIIVFKSPQKPTEDWIKRVIGLPGDVVYYNQWNRQVYVLHACISPNQAALAANESRSFDGSWDLDFTNPVFKGCTYVPFAYGQYTTNKNFLYFNEPAVERTESFSTGESKANLTYKTLQYPKPLDYANREGIFKQLGLPELTWVVPSEQYFVMGDNRDNSKDSRFIGFIPYKNIVGKAEFIWYSIPHDQNNRSYGFWNLDFGRMFTSVYDMNKPDINEKYNLNK